MDTLSKSLVFPYEIEDLQIIEDFLLEKKKKSDRTYANYLSTLRPFLNYVQKPLKEIKSRDLRDYLNKLDMKNLKYDVKCTKRSQINVFFDYVSYRFDVDYNIEYRNPVPSRNVFSFTKKEQDLEEDRDLPLTNGEILEILQLSKKKSMKHFIIYGIIASTGMRYSECLSIKIENIDLEKRIIKTGLVKNAKKSNKMLKYFIPKNFVKYLDLYITITKRTSGFLFNARSKGNNTHYSTRAFRKYCTENFPMKYSKFHRFRHTIITNRIKMGCELWISEGLTNHKISNSTQINHYIRLTNEELRNLYDKWFPYNFIPYF